MQLSSLILYICCPVWSTFVYNKTTNADSPPEPQLMTRNERERREWKRQVYEHMNAILKGGVTRQELADELRVTKQAISSYMKKRTTPKPHILKRLLDRWPHTFVFRGEEFGPEAFGGVSQGSEAPALRQAELFEALSGLKREDMRVEVKRLAGSEAELRVIIKMAV